MRINRLLLAGAFLVPMLGMAGSAGAGVPLPPEPAQACGWDSRTDCARGGSHRGWQLVHYHATVAGGVDEDAGTVCDSTNHCVGLLRTSDIVFGGDHTGTGARGAAYLTADTGVFVVVQTGTFVGTEIHCGTGTVAYTVRGSVDLDQSSVLEFDLDLVPGTGTGDFVGITGHAKGEVDIADPQAVAAADGVLRCRQR